MLADLVDRTFALRGVEWLAQKLGDGGANLVLRADGCEIRCTFVLDHHLEPVGGELLHVVDPAHPLLVRYVDLQADLYFHGGTERSDEVLGALWREHRAACEEWISPHAYLRPDALRGGRGLLASGPRGLLERYAGVLARHGIEPSVIGERPFLEWRAGRWQPRARPPEAILFGRSFVVAEAFR